MRRVDANLGKPALARCGPGALLGLLLIQAGVSAHAENIDLPVSGEDVYFGELPIVLSATRLNQPIAEAPVAVTVIDREMIEASGARELADVFRLVPGFLVGSFDGHQRSVGYHGLLDSFNRRMQVLVDGRSVYTPTFGGVRWSDLPLALEDIERIEVVRGPNAATYGPNSFMGIVSITTRHAADTPGTLVKAAAGDPDYGSVLVRNGTNFGDLDLRVTIQTDRDTGFPGVEDTKQTDRLNVRADYQATARDNFVLNTGYSAGPRREGEATDTNPTRNIDAESYYVQGHWRRTLSPNEEISIQFYRNSFKSEDTFFATSGPLSGEIDFGREGRRTDIELEHTLIPSDTVKIAWGAELRRDQGLSNNMFIGGDYANDVKRLFGNVVWEFVPGTILNTGAMIEKNDLTGTDISPRIALNHRINSNHSVRITASHATRTPSLFEGAVDFYHILDFGGTPVILQNYLTTDRLKPEQIDSIEFGYIFDLPRKGVNGDIKLFRERIRDLISDDTFTLITSHGLPNIGGESSTFGNVDSATIDGVEAQIEWRPDSRNRIIAGGALLHAESDNIAEEYSKTVPSAIVNLLWIHRSLTGLSTGVSYYYTDECRYLGGDQIDAVSRLDFRVSQKFGPRNNAGEIAFVFQNIFGNYSDFSETNTMDQRAYVSLSTQY